MFRCYRQLESSDCGLTCIQMVAHYFGLDVSLKYLRNISDLSRMGMSIKDIMDCCSKIGIKSQSVKITREYLNIMPLPAILYWEQRHFVVLYNVRGKYYYVADPAQGKIKYEEIDFLKCWLAAGIDKGLAIVLEPCDNFRANKLEENNSLIDFINYISQYIKKHLKGLVFAILATFLIMAADFSFPLLLRRTVDEGVALKDIGLVMSLLLCQLGIFIGSLVSSSVMNLTLSKIGLNVNIEMVDSFLKKLAQFPLSFFDRKVSSDFVQKINDISRIKDFLLTYPSSILVMLLNMIVFSALMLHYSSIIFIAFLVLSFFELGWNALFLNRRKALDSAVFSDASENRNHAYELANGMADLKVNNGEYNKIRKWEETQNALNKDSINLAKLNAVQGGGHSMISQIKNLIVTGYSAMMVINGDMTMGTMMTLGYITGRLEQPFNTLSSTIEALQEALLSYLRIDEIVHPNVESRGHKEFSTPTIRFEHVWFKYAGSSSPFIIKDLTLSIESGKTTAIVGESGCGKTTLIKLMLGFYIPQQGKLLLSESPVNDIDNVNWLKHCGAVMQDGKIFTDTILENITMSDMNANVLKAIDSLKSVGLYEFIKKLPMGLNTRIGVSGIELSGGQKQRLLIARALYKNPDILFLDEATSSLDANNEHLIVDNINKFGKGKTVVIAAHRLSTIKNADKIIFIHDGQIVEEGTHQELLHLRGKYWKLVKSQLQLQANA